MTATTECVSVDYKLVIYMEHFACFDFTEFLFLNYPFNQTGSVSVNWPHNFWYRSHKVCVISVSVSASVSLCRGLTNKPAYTQRWLSWFDYVTCAWFFTALMYLSLIHI